MDRTGRIQAIDRAIMILKCFSEKTPELKLSEIVEELDLNKSTVHGIISTLKYHGLIEQDEETQKYRLGVYLMELGDLVSKTIDVVNIARPYIVNLCNQVEETVHLGSLDKLEVIYIDKVESTQSMRIFTARGARNPGYCTGIGKAMLAYANNEILDALKQSELIGYTPNTITDKQKLIDEFENIRKLGYAIDNEEKNIGLTCVAAPIFNYSGEAKYGISISGPTARMTDEKINNIINLVKDATKEISFKLGYKK